MPTFKTSTVLKTLGITEEPATTDEPKGVDPEILEQFQQASEEFSKTQKEERPPTLSLREKLALDFLKPMLVDNQPAYQSYNTKTYVKLAFSYADQFIEQANSYRGDCEMEEIY